MATSRRRRARRTTRSTARRRPVPGWVWLSGGLLIGAAGGYLVWLLQTPVTDRPPAEPAAQLQPAPPPPEKPPAAAKAGAAPPPADERSRFEFYTLLPEMEIEVSDAHVKEALKTPARKSESGPYILQVGSFRRLEEADNLKARIALLGIEAQIQTVVIRDQDVWYRVRVGPYESVRDLAKARTRLQRNDIEAMVLRLGT